MGSNASRPDLGTLLFRSHINVMDNGQYHILTVDVYDDPNYKKEWDHNNRGPYYKQALSFNWQGSEGHDDWYAFRINPNRNESLEQIEVELKLLRRIYRGLEKHHRFDPWGIEARLIILGATQCIYDPRTSELTPLEEVINLDYPGWYADVQFIDGVDTHHGAVIAESEEEAQALVFQQYAEAKQVENAEAFIKCGKPVKIMSQWGGKPDPRPLRQMAILPWMEDIEVEHDTAS